MQQQQQQLVVHNNTNSLDGIPAFSTRSSTLYQVTLEVQYFHNRAVSKLLVLGDTWNFATTIEMSATKCNLPY